jgi:hypothetical protein
MALLHRSNHEFCCPNCGKQIAQRNEKDSNVDSHSANKEEKNESWNMDVSKSLKCGGAAVVGACALPMLAGFGTAGIAGGSLAAIWQSSMGNVIVGSTFAALQSLGATSFFASGAAAGGSAAGAGFISEWWRKSKKTSEEDESNIDENEESQENISEEAVAAKVMTMCCPCCDCVFTVKRSEHVSGSPQ